MTDDWLETFHEVTSSSASLSQLHPLKLDRWHRTLVGLPDTVYMQLGCTALFHHVDVAAQALRQMVELLGADNLPASPTEIARRNIKSFSWLVPSEHDSGTVQFEVSWDSKKSGWLLRCGRDPDTTKTVPDVAAAVEKAGEWIETLQDDRRTDQKDAT